MCMYMYMHKHILLYVCVHLYKHAPFVYMHICIHIYVYAMLSVQSRPQARVCADGPRLAAAQGWHLQLGCLKSLKGD